MIQRIDSVNFRAKQISVLKTAKRSKQTLTDAQIMELNEKMRKVAHNVKINANKAWQSAKDAFCSSIKTI